MINHFPIVFGVSLTTQSFNSKIFHYITPVYMFTFTVVAEQNETPRSMKLILKTIALVITITLAIVIMLLIRLSNHHCHLNCIIYRRI